MEKRDEMREEVPVERGIYEHNRVKDRPRQWWVYIRQRRRENLPTGKHAEPESRKPKETQLIISVTQDREDPTVRIPSYPLFLRSVSSCGPSIPPPQS
jgi:hypothetical protein